MPQDNIVDLQIGQAGSLVDGQVFIDYTTNTISGPGLTATVLGQQISVGALTLQPNGDGTYTILGTTVAVGAIPVASVRLNLASQSPPTTDASVTVAGITTNAAVAVAPLPCFATGTLIATDHGEVAVEDLAVGDIVVTASGAHRPIAWIGHRETDCRKHPRPHEVLPIRIAAHAFGANRPARDLFVSPGHSICVDAMGEVLIPAGALANGGTIAQVDVDVVGYWHVELDSHDILVAENLPAESYLDMGNRGYFVEQGVVVLAASPDGAARTHTDFCRPFHADGPIVEAVRASLAMSRLETSLRQAA